MLRTLFGRLLAIVLFASGAFIAVEWMTSDAPAAWLERVAGEIRWPAHVAFVAPSGSSSGRASPRPSSGAPRWRRRARRP